MSTPPPPPTNPIDRLEWCVAQIITLTSTIAQASGGLSDLGNVVTDWKNKVISEIAAVKGEVTGLKSEISSKPSKHMLCDHKMLHNIRKLGNDKSQFESWSKRIMSIAEVVYPLGGDAIKYAMTANKEIELTLGTVIRSDIYTDTTFTID